MRHKEQVDEKSGGENEEHETTEEEEEPLSATKRKAKAPAPAPEPAKKTKKEVKPTQVESRPVASRAALPSRVTAKKKSEGAVSSKLR